jgi:DNA repair and recombination protein RAD54B
MQGPRCSVPLAIAKTRDFSSDCFLFSCAMYKRKHADSRVSAPFKPPRTARKEDSLPLTGNRRPLLSLPQPSSKNHNSNSSVDASKKSWTSANTGNSSNELKHASHSHDQRENAFKPTSQREPTVMTGTSNELKNMSVSLETNGHASQEASEVVTQADVNQKYTVVWRKITTKKIITWDGDGTLTVFDGVAVLQGEDGKQICRTRYSGEAHVGDILRLGRYEAILEGQAQVEYRDDHKAVSDADLSNSFEPLTSSTNRSDRLLGISRGPRHNPLEEGAIVFNRPADRTKEIVDVVVDPILSAKLRPHQIEGVKFLYECVMGMREYNGKGALLADEMGLGKTLTAITVIWTLLKQTPFLGERPIISRALIVCPATLIGNWKKEFQKWLGTQIGVFVADSSSRIKDFMSGRVYQVMIIGYEKIRVVAEELKSANIDLIICDEGHRIKNAANKSAQAILSLNADKRIMLTGTPIQNDLGEFFAMVDFLNPGLLGSYSTFRREFELPIMKSRQPEACRKDLDKGNQISEQLLLLTQPFILRRSAKMLDNYLHPKTETIVFCTPTERQVALYRQLLQSAVITKCFDESDSSQHLKAITLLKKACNSTLLVDSETTHKQTTVSFSSGKAKLLAAMLRQIYKATEEKVVIVSGYTQTLDLMEQMLKSQNMSFLRLDGSTNTSKRQSLVDEFNTTSQKGKFAFLLSSKSGGTGLNLIGASRLFLYDTDWNPSVDLQAMARIHREGQKKHVYVYRLLVAGTMDEKIFQRQLSKLGLADAVVSDLTNSTDPLNGTSTNSFSYEDLKDLFTLHTDTPSNTHDLLGCSCQIPTVVDSDVNLNVSSCGSDSIEDKSDEFSNGDTGAEDINKLGGWMSAKTVAEQGASKLKKLKANMNGLFDYRHIHITEDAEPFGDEVLANVLNETPVSFIFTKCTCDQEYDVKDLSTRPEV